MAAELRASVSHDDLPSTALRARRWMGQGKSASQPSDSGYHTLPIASAIRRGAMRISSPTLLTEGFLDESTVDGSDRGISPHNLTSPFSPLSREHEGVSLAGDSFVDPRRTPARPLLGRNIVGNGSGRGISIKTKSLPLNDIKSANSLFRSSSKGSDVMRPFPSQGKRKGNPLRTALRRLLGRSVQRNGRRDAVQRRRPSTRPEYQDHHRSDPIIFSSVLAGQPSFLHARSTSLPMQKLTQNLSSELLTTLPNNAESQETVNMSDVDVLYTRHRRRRVRRSTLPSVLLSPTDLSPGTGLAPRPVSGQVRSPARTPCGIGLAITTASNPHRRSQSEGALGTKASAAQSQTPGLQQRRLSDEIRFWRSSVGHPLSPKSPGGRSDDMDDTDPRHHDTCHTRDNEKTILLADRIRRVEARLEEVEDVLSRDKCTATPPSAFTLQAAPKSRRQAARERSISPSTRPPAAQRQTRTPITSAYQSSSTPQMISGQTLYQPIYFHPSFTCSQAGPMLPSKMSPSTPSTSCAASPLTSPTGHGHHAVGAGAASTPGGLRFSTSIHVPAAVPFGKSRSQSASTAIFRVDRRGSLQSTTRHLAVPSPSPPVGGLDASVLLSIVKEEQRARKRLESRLEAIQAELEAIKLANPTATTSRQRQRLESSSSSSGPGPAPALGRGRGGGGGGGGGGRACGIVGVPNNSLIFGPKMVPNNWPGTTTTTTTTTTMVAADEDEDEDEDDEAEDDDDEDDEDDDAESATSPDSFSSPTGGPPTGASAHGAGCLCRGGCAAQFERTLSLSQWTEKGGTGVAYRI